MSVIYSGTGEQYTIGTGVATTDYDKYVKGVNHRGYRQSGASENTLDAFKASKAHGFNYVETDIRFTSDGVCVLVHDATIGNLTVSENTYADLLEASPNLANLTDFMILCKKICLHPYIEIKAGSSAQIESAVEIVKSCGMLRDVTWIDFNATHLQYVKTYDSGARLGYLSDSLDASAITTASNLKNEENEVFVDCGNVNTVTDERVTSCINNGIQIEVWTIDSSSTITSMHKYITGVTSNTLIAGKVMFESVF